MMPKEKETKGTWARCSLRIASKSLAPEQINEIMQHPDAELTKDFWVVDVTADPRVHLHDQLQLAQQYMRESIDKLRFLAENAEISLRIGWAPKPEQDGIAISEELISILAELNAYIMLSTYPDD